MNRLPASETLIEILEADRIWAAYALADLDPNSPHPAAWAIHGRSAAIQFDGIDPPWLSLHGDPADIPGLEATLPSGAVQFALLATHRSLLTRLRIRRETRMWRMALREPGLSTIEPQGCERLGRQDAGELAALFGEHVDRPDAFSPHQLESGVFYGVRRDGRLVAAAGTHVVSLSGSVAAVGNVFTEPARRRRGHARQASAAVVRELVASGIATIVLNVSMANAPALELYRSLGFWPFVGYYEGVGEIAPA